MGICQVYKTDQRSAGSRLPKREGESDTMSAQNKLALGLSLFVVLFVIAFMAIPPNAYEDYFSDLKRRNRTGAIRGLVAGVFVLSLPYFYDELIGLDSRAASILLQATIGACAFIIFIDVAVYLYRNFGPHSRRAP